MGRSRRHALLVVPTAPASGGNGLAMRAGLFLEGLARSHEVTVAIAPGFGVASTTDDGLVDRLAWRRIELAPAGPEDAASWPTELLATPAGRLRAAEIYPLPELCPRLTAPDRALLRRLAAEVGLVHVMRTYLAPCLDAIFDAPARPVLTLDLDELDSAVVAEAGDSEAAARFARLESWYVPRCDGVYTAGPGDARIVRERFDGPVVEAIPNAVRPPAVRAPNPSPRYDLVFVGNLSYAPNVEAVLWLCHRVLPRLPGCQAALVGSHPGPEVRALADLPGVTVAADVPEVTPWYAEARVAVVPVRRGGGTRTKIVEALAHGVPVIATPRGAEGVAVGAEAGVLVAEGEEAFAAACRRLGENPREAARLGAAGRRSVPMAEDVIARIDAVSRRAQGLQSRP